MLCRGVRGSWVGRALGFPPACLTRSHNGFHSSIAVSDSFDFQAIRAVKASFPPWLIREMRSNHAGETGAVMIYRGAEWALQLRASTRSGGLDKYEQSVLEFVQSHKEAEEQHLKWLERILDSGTGERSVFIALWRASGFMLGAVSTIWCPRGLYLTTDAVETFVEKHYNHQIERLSPMVEGIQSGKNGGADFTGKGGHDLLRLLKVCCEDEVHHKLDARMRAKGLHDDWPNPPKSVDRAWMTVVEQGSALAAATAKLV